MQAPIIIGNWKMNKTVSETIRTLTELKNLLSGKQEAEVAVAPPFTALYSAQFALEESQIKLAAQNMYPAESGAYTGEISPAMLAELGVSMVIIGHSERRKILGESDTFIRQKVSYALESGLVPILCVGETEEEREAGKTEDVIERQLSEALRGVVVDSGGDLIIAYEPVWAIGTGKTATPEQAQEVHAMIKEQLFRVMGQRMPSDIRVIYGGSVKPENIAGLMAMKDIDGALVGGASLDARTFAKIVQYRQQEH